MIRLCSSCDGRDNYNHRSPERATSIEILSEADELDLESTEFIQHFQEMARRAGQSIRKPRPPPLGNVRDGRPPAIGLRLAASRACH